jgi:Spy/CpxP family protein refolding chaperone
MNRWIRRVVMFTSLAGALALLPGAVAMANESAAGEHAKHGHGHHGGLMSAALKLDNLSADQRSQIERLEAQRKAANVPVRQADARVLTELAHQVEQAKIDRDGLKSSLSAEESAAQAARAVDVSSLAQLHTTLTPAQCGALVDMVEARLPSGKASPAELEAFRGASFDASAMVKGRVPGMHAIERAEAKVPSMTPAQRAEFANHLRERAAHESKV